MKVIIYGTEPEKQEFERAFSLSSSCCYRKIEIVGFSNYDSFIAGLASGSPECIVVTMDGADGMEGVIAAKNMFKNIPVIWFSNDNGFGVQSYRLGCAYFHQKPVSPEILSAAIAKCV